MWSTLSVVTTEEARINKQQGRLGLSDALIECDPEKALEYLTLNGRKLCADKHGCHKLHSECKCDEEQEETGSERGSAPPAL